MDLKLEHAISQHQHFFIIFIINQKKLINGYDHIRSQNVRQHYYLLVVVVVVARHK
jgi:hypothetical protein